jgi:hypothetical protein
MVQMLFHIQFRSQLRRIRPELIASLEGAVAEAASAAGGNAEAGRKVLTASFDESRIGFWLDMVIFLEKVHKALEKTPDELYGYILALGSDIPETSFMKLCISRENSRAKKNERRSTGIWCSELVREALEHYIVFDSNGPESTGNCWNGGLLAAREVNTLTVTVQNSWEIFPPWLFVSAPAGAGWFVLQMPLPPLYDLLLPMLLPRV